MLRISRNWNSVLQAFNGTHKQASINTETRSKIVSNKHANGIQFCALLWRKPAAFRKARGHFHGDATHSCVPQPSLRSLSVPIDYLPTRMWHVIKQPACERQMAQGNILTAVIVWSLHSSTRPKPATIIQHGYSRGWFWEPRGIDGDPPDAGALLRATRGTDRDYFLQRYLHRYLRDFPRFSGSRFVTTFPWNLEEKARVSVEQVCPCKWVRSMHSSIT